MTKMMRDRLRVDISNDDGNNYEQGKQQIKDKLLTYCFTYQPAYLLIC